MFRGTSRAFFFYAPLPALPSPPARTMRWCARVALASQVENRPLRGAMPAMINTPEMRFQVDESRKFAAIDEVRARLADGPAQVDGTDGVRVTTDDGWWLLRASNTQDVLVARAESDSEAGLERLMAQIDEQLALSGLERGAQAGH